MRTELELLVKVLGVIGGISGINQIAKWISTYWRWRSKRSAGKAIMFSGNWNNQGQIRNVPSHYIDLDSAVAGGRLTGQFNVRLGNGPSSWTMFAITGKRRLGKIKCEILVGEEEEATTVATGILKLNGKKVEWHLTDGSTQQFPSTAILRRGLPKIA